MWIAITPEPWRPEWQAPLVAAAATLTPTMVWREHILLLDIEASLQWLGGIRGLKRQTQREIAAVVTAGHIVMARTALGAWLLALEGSPQPARWRWRYALSAQRLSQRLDHVALTHLPQTQPYRDWFAHLGCHTLGQLRALDRSELQARTSHELLNALDQAYGQAVFTYQPLTLPVQFHQRRELPRLIQDTTALEPYVKRLLDALCIWLKANHLAVSRLECRLHHRDRQRAHQPTVITLSIAQASDEHALLWRWFAVRLDRMTLPAQVSDIAMLTRTLCARQERNLRLFDDDVQTNSSVSQTLDLLRARLGQASVRQAQPKADYRAEVANTWQASGDTAAMPASIDANSLTQTDWGAHCPAWLLPEPKALSTRQDQPQLQGPLRLLQGPWRVETGWWDQQLVARDYFVASDTSARRYWIYRERDQTRARWFLHGLFG